MVPLSEEIAFAPVLVVDDDPAVRARARRLLQDCGVTADAIHEAADIARAQAIAAQCAPSLALVDVGLPDGSGVDLVAWLQARYPALATVVVSAFGDGDTVVAALRNGAIGYLLKEREDAELHGALESIRRGGAPIDPFVARKLLSTWARRPAAPADAGAAAPAGCGARGESLTRREREILGLVARGYSNREIAGLMALSRFTIEDHTKRIYRKLAVTSRTEAVFEAQNQGLLG